MKCFQELTVTFPDLTFEDAIEVMAKHAVAGWQRDKAVESRMRALTVTQRKSACFSQPGETAYHPVALWLVSESPHTCKVSNIVPGGKQSVLSFTEYNDVLAAFARDVVKSFLMIAKGESSISSDEVRLESFASPATVSKLVAFSATANKSTGSAHPLDFKRWCEFLISIHKEGSTLDGYTLGRWLREAENWPDEVTSSLVGEYEFARELLQLYDGK